MSKRIDGLQPPKTTAEAVNYFLIHVPLAATDGYEQLECPDAEHWKFRTPNGFDWVVGTDGSVIVLDEDAAPAVLIPHPDEVERVRRAEEQADELMAARLDDGKLDEDMDNCAS